MSGKLSSDLKDWFLTLGFDDKNLSANDIEDEFNKLSPPEMRDIWRNIKNHVVPVDRSRYIMKVLLLHKLKKLSQNTQEKQLITRNVDSVKKLQRLINQRKVAGQVNNCLRSVEKTKAEVNNRNQKIFFEENKLKNLVAENSERSNQQGLIELKVFSHEKKLNELCEIHSFLTHINSSWYTKSDSKLSSNEFLKDLLKKVNEFGKLRDDESNDKIADAQRSLMNDVLKQTSVTPVSELHKIVIYMLRDTLSALLKLSDNVNAKQNNECNRDISSKLVQMKKQSVELFIENAHLKRKIEKLREDVQNQRCQLLTASKEKYDEQTQKNFEMWLDSENLKHCMKTRLNYLTKKEESMKNMLPISTISDFTSFLDEEKLFKAINDCKNQMVLMEKNISNNLQYLSDKPIDSFIQCQNHCKNRIEQFINTQNFTKSDNFVVQLKDSFRKEIDFLQTINSTFRNDQLIPKNESACDVIPDYLVDEFIKKSSFYVYLIKTFNEMKIKAKKETNVEFFERKQMDLRNAEEEFAHHVKELVTEAKINLKCVEEHCNSCLKNYDLWTKASVNEIIPQQMLLADRNFIEWHKRYSTVIQCLRKQKIELSKLE